jgi:energy-coupling factor transporter ATP-binding protein EcfA2
MKPRPYVNKLESCIKGAVVAQPGRKTLVLGPNGAGKSALVNALEAAGSGKVSDVAGRYLLAKDADLSMLSHADRVWSEAHLSDGSKAIWELSKGHRAKRTGPEIAFPLRGVRDAILGSPETARKWVLEQSGEALRWPEIVALIPMSLQARLSALSDPAGPDSIDEVPAPARITGALEEARKRVREANATAKAHRAVTAPPGPPASDEEVAKYEAIIKGWEARGAAPAIDSTREALVVARENAEALAKLVAHSEEELTKIGDLTPTSALRTAAVTVVEAMAAKRTASCWICGGKCDPTTIATRAVAGRAQITADASAAKRRLDLEFTLREANADLTSARREVERLAAEEARIERLAKSETAQATPLPIPLEDARNLLRGAYDRRAGWAAARRAEEKALEAERESQEWSQLADALGKALGILVEKARAAFEARVQKYLPEGDIFGIDLLDEDREIMRVGLRRVDRVGASHLDAALSGAEWARVTAALALATAPAEGPCVIVPEERAFDTVMLARVLEYLPEGDIFGIDLLDEDREIMRVGLRRLRPTMNPTPNSAPGTYYLDAALSGAEWARVTAALALATAPAEGPCVIVPEERAFDTVMLARVLEVWDRALPDDSAPQVVITSPIEPARIPSGWTVIRVGKVDKAAEEKGSGAMAPREAVEELGRQVMASIEKGVALPIDLGPADLEARDAREREALNLPKRRGRPPGKKNAPKEEAPKAEAPLEFFPVKDAEGNTVGLKPKKAEPKEAAERAASDLFDPFA